MEKLNIKELFNKKNKETSNSIIKVDYNMPPMKEKFSINYSEINKKTGEIITITGNKKQGYHKHIRYKDSSIQKNFIFYSDGLLESKSSSYIGHLKKLKNDKIVRPNFSFGVGKSYSYDNKGNVIREVDSDEGFEIPFEEIEKSLLEKVEIDLNQYAFYIQRKTKEQMINYFKEVKFKPPKYEACWDIHYKKPGEDKIFIISGVTGEIIYKSDVIYEEN